MSLTGRNLTIANFVYSVDGNNYNGVCETSPPQQAEANAGTYKGTWEREDSTGQITLNISADGKLTGTMTVDGQPGEAALTGMVDNAGKYVFTYKFPTAPLFRSKGTYTKTGNTINGTYNTEEIGKEGTTSGTFSVTLVGDVNFVTEPSISGGGSHSLALKSNGTVWAWGNNVAGQLGDGTNTNHYTPAQVIGLSEVTAIAAGYDHCLALRNDGTVWAWGDNSNYELGIRDRGKSNIPVQVSELTGVIAIAAGRSHSLALKNDGTVWAWGRQADIDDSVRNYSKPYHVSGLNEVVAVTAGVFYSLVLKSDRTVWLWGRFSFDHSNYVTPIQVSGLSEVTSIAAGGEHFLALKSDGSVWSWGKNWYGQLGGDYKDGFAQVSEFSANVLGLGGGDNHSLALLNNGTIMSWGRNTYGQLGDGTNTDKQEPVGVISLSNCIRATRGWDHSLALKSDGTVWAWGSNNSGQLGDGTTTDQNTPVQVVGLNLKE